MRAAFYGYLSVVRAMAAIDSAPSFINAVIDDFGSALCAAVSGGHEDIVDFLLGLPGVDPNVFNSNYETPLVIAAKRHDFSIFTKILNFRPIAYRPADGDNDDRTFETKLKNLKEQLNLSFLNFISDFEFNKEYCCNFDDKSSGDDRRMKMSVSFLPTCGMLENIKYENCYILQKNHQTYTIYLIFYKQIINKLLKHIHPEYFTNYKSNEDDQKFVQFFLNCDLIDYGLNCHGCNHLVAAVRSKNYNMVEMILKKEATDVNFADFYGMTPLMYAALNGSFDIIKLMIENGAKSNQENKKVNINKQNYYERTAILFATYSNNWNIVEYLLNHPSFDAEKSNLLLTILCI